jgi:tetratricopeptide (TPR) repeat protein
VPGRPGSAARRAEAEARRVLAAALAVRLPAELPAHRPAREARRAAELAPGWVEARLVAAGLEEERNRRLEHLRAAQAEAPADPRVLRGLAQVSLALDRPHEAVRLLERAVAAAPGWVAARLTLAAAREQAGQGARSTAERLALGERAPLTAPAAAAAAGAARRLGRVERAAGLYRTALALQVDDGATRASLASLLLGRGDVAGAVSLAEEALRLDPADLSTRLRLADLLAANGRAEEAEAAWAAALRLCPEEADAWERRGRARLLAGRQAEALADLSRALELRPQSPALKELVRSLEPARERFEAPYLLDAAALARAPAKAAADDDAVTLGEVEVVRVHRSGLASRSSQRIIKVLTQRGADAARRQSVGYTPDRQEVKIERGRIFKADGTVVEAWEESERSASEPWYRLYYDTRAKTLTFPALAPGDVLEVAWRVDDTAAENLLSDYFGDIAYLEDGDPKRRWEYVLLMPQGRAIHANAPAGVTREDRDLPGGLTEHRWRALDVPRIDTEPRMAGWSEVARFLHVSTYGSWEEVNRFYWGLIRDQLRPTDELRALARRLGEEALRSRGLDPAALARGAGALDRETQLAIVGAVHGFVVMQTRYVGLEFGIHGYKPYRVDQILSRRFGDCKDKASLTYALLQVLGIDSRLVLLRMRRLGRLPEQPASLAVFNHAILHLPQFGLWLDGTAAHTGTREIPGEDRGATVLVVDPGGKPWFGRTPEARPEENLVDSRFDVTLEPDGAARVDGTSRIAGVQAASYRRAYQAENDRRATLEQAFNRVFPGLSAERVSFGDLSRLEEDVTMTFRLRAPRYAEAADGLLRFTPFGAGATYAETWASLSSRRHDLEVGDPATTRFRYQVALPPGWTVRELPEPAAGDAPHAAFEVRYRQEAGVVVVEGFVALKTPLVPPADYPAFRALMLRIDAAFSRRVVAAPALALQEAR